MNEPTMKKIRIDYYNYRLRKGRACILLQYNALADKYCVPSRYVEVNERIDRLLRSCPIEDDGDLVLIANTLNKPHLSTKGKNWVPLEKVREVPISSGTPLRVYQRIFRYFLPLCPKEGESGLRKRVEEVYEAVKIDIAKKEYMMVLQQALDGKMPEFRKATVSLPDPSKVKQEMETLERFRLYKPNYVPMNMRDGYLLENDLYSYRRIDWKALGLVIEPFLAPPTFDIPESTKK